MSTQETDTSRVRAVVLTTQRTGSTFLVECLGSHPDIDSASEILVGDPLQAAAMDRSRFRQFAKLANYVKSGAFRPGHRMDKFFRQGTARVRVFKVMYNHLANPFALRYLRRHEDVRILHLHRHNLLKVHVSKLLMPMRERVQALAPVDAIQIHVDPAGAIASMRRARAQYERFERLFERHRRLPLTYEELFDGAFLRADTAVRVCDFLDVPRLPMHSRIVKLNPESLREMVSNYRELAAAVADTEFANMLD